MTFEEKKREAVQAIDFLYNHPAINPDVKGNNIADGFYFSLAPVCKHRYTENAGRTGISVYAHSKYSKKFRKELIAEWKEYEITSLTEKKLTSVEIEYEKIFNEPWAFDHVEFWPEITFYVFNGNPYSNTDYFNCKYWQGYSGPEIGNNKEPILSFEDMVIETAKTVKKHFGDFNRWNDFKSQAEIKNNEIEPFMNPTEKNERGCYPVIFNEKNVDVYPSLVNLRWLNWYVDNISEEQVIKDWGEDTLKEWKYHISKIDEFEPKERKELLKNYV